jgi:glycerol-3-phosphate dehydrogenase
MPLPFLGMIEEKNIMDQPILEAEVVIIGGGVTGAAIARELSRYQSGTVLVEKGGELCAGQTKGSLGNIYTGLNLVGSMILKSVLLPPGTPLTELYHPHTLHTKWCEEGFREWESVLNELDIKHRYVPLTIIAKDENQIKNLKKIRDLGWQLGGMYADFEQIDREEILTREPNVNPEVMTALFASRHVIDIFPPEVAIALAENAVENGCKVLLNTEVIGISQSGLHQIVQTSRGSIKTNFIVNAACGWGDKISDMAGGGRDWGLQYRKTVMIILDTRCKGLVNGMVRWPNVPGRLDLVQRREDNILIECGTYDPTDRPDDTYTIREDVIKSMEMAKTIIPSISEKDIINTFTGVRVFNTRDVEDHIVEFHPANKKFLNVMIRLPGIIGALPMARHVAGMLQEAGCKLVIKDDFKPYRKAIPKFRDLNDEMRNSLIEKNSLYGHLVCRCETVTEGQIVEAIIRGGSTEEGIRMRTRAGMGRCKGGFCGPRVVKILARELNIPVTEVKKRSLDSPLLLCKSKELLLRNEKGIA